MKTIAQGIATRVEARLHCIETGSYRWAGRHEEEIERLVDLLPSGSGIDSGNEIDYDKSRGNKLVINSGYHIMDEMGGYTDWIDYRVVVTPSLINGILVNIIGQFSGHANTYDLKDYLHELYYHTLNQSAER